MKKLFVLFSLVELIAGGCNPFQLPTSAALPTATPAVKWGAEIRLVVGDPAIVAPVAPVAIVPLAPPAPAPIIVPTPDTPLFAADPQNLGCVATFWTENGALLAVQNCEGIASKEILATGVARLISVNWTWQVQFNGDWNPLLIIVYLDDRGEIQVMEVNTEKKFGR